VSKPNTRSMYLIDSRRAFLSEKVLMGLDGPLSLAIFASESRPMMSRPPSPAKDLAALKRAI